MENSNKIKVFISSKCGGKYEIVRKALKKLIEKTDLATAYIYESAPASSCSNEDSYLSNVENCDVFVLLIDNNDAISEAVLKEYNRAKAFKKKMLCFFCNENNKTQTSIQEELIKTGICKFAEVSLFSDIVEKAYDAFFNDVIIYYISNGVNNSSPVLENSFDKIDEMTYPAFNKKILSSFTFTQSEFICRLFPSQKQKEDIPAELDGLVAIFLKTVLCDKKFDEFNFHFLKLAILKNYNGHIKTVISYRLDAIKFYFKENLEKSIDILQEAVDFIKKSKSVPTWVLNDVAIDLRNLIYKKENLENKIVYENKGQKILEESSQTVIFPALDRISNTIQTNAIKQYIKIELESPYTSSHENLDMILKSVVLYYCQALMFGSLTHLELVLSKYNDLLMPLCLAYDDGNFFFELINNLVLLSDLKMLDKYMRTLNIDSSVFSSFKIEEISRKIDNLPLSDQRNDAKLLLMKHFGYFFSDKQFELETKWLYKYSIEWLNSSLITSDAKTLIFDAYKSCCQRLDRNILIDFAIICLESKNSYVTTDALNLISDISFKNTDTEEQKKLEMTLIDLIKNKNENNTFLHFAIIYFCLNCTIDYTDLQEVIKSNEIEFYNGAYKLELLDKEKDDFLSQIHNYIQTIILMNKTQSKNSYSMFAGNPYGTIWNIISKNELQLEWEELLGIVNACKETILAPAQGPKEKIEAIKLVINLKHLFPLLKEWGAWINEIVEKKDVAIDAFFLNFLDKTSQVSLNFALQFLLLAFERENEAFESISELYTIENYNLILCLDFLDSISSDIDIDKISENILSSILQLSIALSQNKEQDIRFFSVKLLIKLTHSRFKLYALKQLSKCFDKGSYKIKAAIVCRVNEIDDNLNIVKYIKQKASIDNNYLVRKLAIKEQEA